MTPVVCPDGTHAHFQSNTDAPDFDSDYPSFLAATSVFDCFAIHPGRFGVNNTVCPLNTFNPFFFGIHEAASSTQRGC